MGKGDPMKWREFVIAFGLVASATLIAIGASGCTGSPAQTGWRASANRSAMLNIRPDMSVEEVSKVMGLPDKTELCRGKGNEAILIYLYITEGRDALSRTWNESNYTPFVFVDDRLHGWGWSNLEFVAKRYEFVIKQR
jgi:hypothetical protein